MMPIAVPQLPGNDHLRMIADHFRSLAISAADIPRHETIVFICFTNRSGSNYLAEALHSSGRFNLAGELLNGDAVLDDVRLHGHPRFADYVTSQMAWRMVDGRFAMKLAIGHLEILGRAGFLDHCRATSHFVFIERSDRLGQAISYEIARQTGQWTSETTVEVDIADLVYSRQGVIDAMDGFAGDNREFDRFFGRNGILPTHVVYEHLLAEPQAAVRASGRATGLPDLAMDPARIGVRRQSGALNAHWRELYLAGR